MAHTYEGASLVENRVESTLDSIRGMQSIDEQFKALNADTPYSQCTLPRWINEAEFDSLINFALDPVSSPSLIVRAQALENAIDGLREQSPYAEELEERRQQVVEFMGEEIYRGRTRMLIAGSEGGADPFGLTILRYFMRTIADKEGMDLELLFPDRGQWIGESIRASDPIPTAAFAMLRSLAYIQMRPDGKLPVGPMAKLVPLAAEIQQAEGGEIDVLNASGIAYLTYAAEGVASFLELASKDAAPYQEALESLKQSTALLKDIFPTDYAEGIEAGALELAANCMYAVRYHLANGKQTEGKLPLNQDFNNCLDITLTGEEPLELMQLLEASIRQLHRTVLDPEMVATKVNKTGDFNLYRIWDGRSLMSAVSVYVRPIANSSYDSSFEYGRNGRGVEASISYVIDPLAEEGSLIEVGKHRKKGPDNRVSIRLDRECRDWKTDDRDPTQFDGKVSLDIGSVLGGEQWLGTRIGRFIAWGDMLRTQSTKRILGLNHVVVSRGYWDGTLVNFAGYATEMIEKFEDRSLSNTEVVALLAGAQAVHAAHNTK